MAELCLVVEPQVNKTRLYRPKIFPKCFVFCGGADEIGEIEFVSRRFLRVRYKNFSTNQNRGITRLSQGCSNATLGTRLGYQPSKFQCSRMSGSNFLERSGTPPPPPHPQCYNEIKKPSAYRVKGFRK